MNQVEYISARISLALLSLAFGYVLVVILPVDNLWLAQSSIATVGKLSFFVALIQILGIGGLWLSVANQKWLALILNMMAIGLVVFFFIATAPNSAIN